MMLLSTAIRLGALLRPQGFKSFFDESGASCAMGAALEACGEGRSNAYDNYMAFHNRWYHIADRRTDCPECPHVTDLGNTIIHLNDKHRLTREQIADFVEGVERSLGLIPDAPLPADEQSLTLYLEPALVMSALDVARMAEDAGIAVAEGDAW